MKELDQDMQDIIRILRERGADWTAASLENNWKNGRAGYIDSRNSTRRGLVRRVNAANARAIAE